MAETPTDDEWQISYSGGFMKIEMSEEDARLIETRAKEAGLSVEVYLRRAWGFADSPPSR